MKHEQVLTLRKDNFLVRDKLPFTKQFELFMPDEQAMIKIINFMKEKFGLKIISNLWKFHLWYLEVESIHPIFKGTILTESKKQLELAESSLKKLLLSIP